MRESIGSWLSARSEYFLWRLLKMKFALFIIMHMIFEEDGHVSLFQVFTLG